MVKSFLEFRWAVFLRMLAIAVIPVVLVGILARIYIQRNTIRAVQRDNQAAATMAAASADAYLRVPTELVQQAAHYLGDTSLAPAGLQTYLQSVVANSDALEALLLIDDKGIVQQAAMPPALAYHVPDVLQMDLSRQGVAAVSRATTRPTWSPIGRSPWSGRKTISICHSIGTMTLLGVLNVDALSSAVRASGCDEQHAVAILDASGNVYFQSSGSDEALLMALARTDIVRQGLAARGFTATVAVEGNDHITSVAPIQSTGWFALVSIPSDIAYTPLRDLDLLLASLLIGLLILIAATAVAFASRLARPLQSLNKAAASAAAGNYESPFPSQRYAEMEGLAHSFREMAAAIRLRDDKLRSTQATLNFAASGTAQQTGHAFFTDLVNVLAATTGARCALVTEWLPGTKPRARILAAHTSVPMEEGFAYDISGSPCAHLADKAICHITSGTSAEYSESPVMRLLGAEGYIGVPLVLGNGEVAGHIAILDDHDLPLDDQMHNLLLVLAARGGAELERIQAERRIKESELLYRTIVQDQTELIRRSTLDGTLTFANEAYCRYFGKGRDELVGRTFLSHVIEEDRELIRRHFASLSIERPCQAIEYRVCVPSGEIRWQQWTNRVITDSKGRIVEYQGTGQDTTAYRKVELALSESEQRFRQLAENISSVFWLSDWATQKILYVSPAFERVWGLPESDLRDNPLAWTIAIVEEDRARVARQFLLHAAEGPYTEEYRISRSDGSQRWIRDRRFPIRNAEGQVYRIAGLAEDITHERMTQQA